ncbi:MAG: hypothetical protein GXP26_07240 [Planctomycetes bacterium]|nr:hypothetical protein [Planctomycetota bacterium]
MMVEDNNSPGAPKVVFDADAPVAVGVFSSNLYFEDAGAWTSPYAELRIGARGANASHNYWQGTVAMYLKFNGSTLQLTTLSGGSPVNTTLDNSVLLNATNSLELSFDTNTDTFTGILNGVALSSGGGANSTFAFTSDQTGIASVEFVGGWTSKTGMRFFVDDINLAAIPEPGSLSLVCLGVFVTFATRARKFPRG